MIRIGLVGATAGRRAGIVFRQLGSPDAEPREDAWTRTRRRSRSRELRSAFGSDIDFAMLVKLYGNDNETESRYSPGEFVSCRAIPMIGRPKQRDISTSFVERQNLTMRMQMRRFTRLTNASSKKVENLGYAVALHFMHYNFCRVHQTLRVPPAMEGGIADHVWTIEELVGLLDASRPSSDSSIN